MIELSADRIAPIFNVAQVEDPAKWLHEGAADPDLHRVGVSVDVSASVIDRDSREIMGSLEAEYAAELELFRHGSPSRLWAC